MKMNLMNCAEERALLQHLDQVLSSEKAIQSIAVAVEIASSNLHADAGAALAWEPIPLAAYGSELPSFIQSSWVFILRARTITGAERHPNSHQRLVSYRGSGDFQISFQGSEISETPDWHSNLLTSSAVGLDQRWVSIPTNTWHQGVTGDDDWIVVSFQTAPERELIEERPDPADFSTTVMRTYL